MKNFIYKTNQYLLERYPTLWNTKIVWMLLTALLLHIIFYILGFFALTNLEILHEHDAKSIFFKNGTVFISIILSILILVFWLIYLFKNNAFKSFYPTSRCDLFKQFLCYVIIIFSTTTFFLSYNVGLKQYISSTYPDNVIEKEINASNNASLFFSHQIETYTINRRRYPAPFDSLYCETYEGFKKSIGNNRLSIDGYENDLVEESEDTLAPHLKFLDSKYYFYTLNSKEGKLNQAYNDTSYAGYVFYKTRDTLRTYFYKEAAIDVSDFVATANPSYFNYSSQFYQSKKDKKTALDSLYEDEGDYYPYNDYKNKTNFSKQNKLWNKTAYDLLTRNNTDEIKSILADFLAICNQYAVKHNLSANEWFDLIYHPENFELKALIRSEPKSEYNYGLQVQRSALETFIKNSTTDFYIDEDSLHNVFENIEEIKSQTPYLESIHLFMWLAVFFSSIIFMFRITGLKPLLFTIISIGVITLLVTLLSVLFSYVSGFDDNSIGYFISYLTLILGTTILSIPIFYSKKIKKGIVAICLNMSIIGFVLYVFLIITTISMHQADVCSGNYSSNLGNENCFNLLGSVGIYWSYILFITNLIFIYFYSGIIKKWKALPES